MEPSLDTGGIDDTTEMFQRVKELSLKSAKEADIIIFMVDGKEIPQDEDRRLFYQLQSLKKPIALVVNKIDNDRERDKNFWEFTQFGAKDIFGISITHNRYMNNLYRWLESHIPQKEERDNLELIEDFDPLFDNINSDIESDITDEEDNREINVAIIGRVNSGKSSLLNALLKEDRAVVSDVAGTTIDPVDESIEYRDYKITFIGYGRNLGRRGNNIGWYWRRYGFYYWKPGRTMVKGRAGLFGLPLGFIELVPTGKVLKKLGIGTTRIWATFRVWTKAHYGLRHSS